MAEYSNYNSVPYYSNNPYISQTAPSYIPAQLPPQLPPQSPTETMKPVFISTNVPHPSSYTTSSTTSTTSPTTSPTTNDDQSIFLDNDTNDNIVVGGLNIYTLNRRMRVVAVFMVLGLAGGLLYFLSFFNKTT